MMETEQTVGSNAQVLVRPQAGRILAGVAAGIANRLSLPAWLVRVIFVILTASGGVGLLLYFAGMVMIPAEGDAKAAAGQFLGRIEGPRAWVGVGIMAVAAMIVADSALAIDADIVAAGVLILIGVLLYRGDIGSSSSHRGHPTTEEATTTMTYTTTGGTTTETVDLPGGDPVEPPPPPPEAPVPAAALPPAPPPPPRERSILGRLTVAIGLITLGVMALFDNAGAVGVDFRHYLGAAMTVIGIGLLVGSVFGRARGLIVLGVILVPALLASPVADLDFDSTEASYAPTTVADIETEYSLDVGRLEIDLSAVEFDGEEVRIEARLGLGEMIIIVPDDVAIEAYGEVGLGQVEVLGGVSGGIGELSIERSAEGPNGLLIIDARTDVGRVQVQQASFGPRSLGDFGGDTTFVTTSNELENSYEFGIGDFIIDLSQLNLEIDRAVSIDMGTGTLRVILPVDIASEVEATVGIGDLTLPDGRRSGLAPEGVYENGPDPRLSLDIEVAAGELIVEEASR